MTKIEELHHIIELLKKHDLPISPILEYAIKEREDQYIMAESLEDGVAMVCEPQPEFTVYKELEDYEKEFTCLSVGISGGKKLPHKAILLIGIMRLIENGIIDENKIPLEKPIADVFSSVWNEYFAENHVPSVWTPFYHLKSESFWHFKAADTEEKLQMLMSFGGTPSVGKMRPVIKYAYLDEALFSFMKNAKNRNMLTAILVNTYIKQ